MTTQEHAIVWRYTQGVSSTETLKPLTIRLLNPSVNARQPLPLGILVPTSEEPALLVVVPATGKITYWDSISSAASVDSSRQKQNCAQGFLGGLMSGEVVTKVIEGEPHGFALPLNSGRVAHITISDLQGKPSIATHFLQSDGAQSVGFFGGLKNVFGSAGWRRNIAAVRAGFSAHRGHRQLVVATSKGRFQIWDLNWNGTQSLLHEIDGKADFLKSLVEGGEVFRDHQDHQFEVLDFTFSPIDLESKQTIIHKGKGDCQLWVLTVLHGPDSSKYNLIGVIIAAGSLAVHVVHPLACYKSLLSPDTEFKPQVLVPEEGFVAFVVFEKSVVLISLVEVEESPSSQLKVESNTLSDPFQDSIEYNKTRGYRNLACAAEAADGSQSSSCIFLVYGFGVIRFTALPMQKGQSAVDRATVTAATKIEQAMFFGTLPQNLLDFSGRPEIAFSQEQIERAAEDVSDAILKGESKYIPREMPSMESQLSRRAAALQDLIRHLKQRYGVLGRPTRWRLLWDAEKMAAAEAIWRTYQHMKEETKQVKHKNFLAEVIEVCSEKYKVENQVEDYETDGVRHWFVNDIWRLEYLLPYTDRTIQELIDEKAELGEGTDTITHARYIYEAIEIQIAALKTAFRFRELNLPSYDLASESVVDGVLLQGYENLDEPWTADGNVAARVKELTERAVKFLEDIDEPDYADNPILMKLRDNCPQQVQLFNQTQIEQFRWLKAHSDQQQRATGEALQEQYFELRKELFHGLADLGCGDQAVELAEKYEDMDALVELVELKRLSAMESFTSHVSEDNEAALRVILKTCDEQIISYFTKYGVPWADAYFSKHIANNAAGRVLEQSPMYQKALTAFLRRRPQYSKLRWINEVTAEGNYVAAAESLRQTQARETKLWFKKVELAMQKLTLLAATQQAQLKNEDAKAPLRSTEKSVAIIEVQEMFYDYLRPLLKSAIDVEAESDIVLAKYEDVRKHQHCIENIMKRDIARLVAREVLEPEDLIDTLIFMDPHGQGEDDDFIDHRFFLALKVLSHLDLRKSDPTRHELLESAIWRRCYIQNDWESINRTEDKDEEQTTAETEVTSFFITAKELYANGAYFSGNSIGFLILLQLELTSSRYSAHRPFTSLAPRVRHHAPLPS